MEITEAATTPVVAASSAPTKTTRIGEAAGEGVEKLTDRVEEVPGHAGSFGRRASPMKVKNGIARRVSLLDHAIEPVRQRLHLGLGVKRPELDADDREEAVPAALNEKATG